MKWIEVCNKSLGEPSVVVLEKHVKVNTSLGIGPSETRNTYSES